MGIRFLTSYIEFRYRQYYDLHKLHDCKLVIDGSSLCYSLYNWEYSYWKNGYSYDCYGGDYDKYAEIVRGFFWMLKECNVTPYIIFGGRNSAERVSVIKGRLDNKVQFASEIDPDVMRKKIEVDLERKGKRPIQNMAVGAVGLKCAFRDVLKELDLNVYSCVEEPNREMASLAKEFNCPVLSGNSDFYVLGSMFIPFSSIKCEIIVNRSQGNWRNTEQESFRFIPCKLYTIEKLLYSLNKRPNQTFISYLLPVLLGSDYLEQDTLEPFFQKNKIGGSKHQKIDGIFDWIKRQYSLEVSIKEILDSFDDQKQRNAMSQEIQHTIMGYSSVSIDHLLKHFDVRSRRPFDVKNVNRTSKLLEVGNKDDSGSESSSDLFLKRHTSCRYPSFFMDMLKEDRYFIPPNVEDISRPDANSIGYPLMSAIHNILAQNDQKTLTVFRRNSDIKMEEFVLPAYPDELPSIDEIDYIQLERRKDLLLKVLEIDQSFCLIFEGLPSEWELFLLSLKYVTLKSEFDFAFISSQILCFIILNYVDNNLKTFCRTVKDFRYVRRPPQKPVGKIEKDKFPHISEQDSYNLMEKCVKYFEMSREDDRKTYDRDIVHSVAEFQCVFLHLKDLNNLLNFPFKNMSLHNIFDNTFTYNMCKHLRQENKSLKNYLNDFLQDCPSVQSGFSFIVQLLEDQYVL